MPLSALVLALLAAQAQSAFDAATVKLNTSNARGASLAPLGAGRVRAQNVTLRMLIEEAFHLQASQLTAPAWFESERYDVNTKSEGNPDKKQTLEMLQRLLVEQFAIKSHWTSKDVPLYRLKIGKGGSKLKLAAGGCTPPQPCGGFNVRRRSEVAGRGVTTEEFADLLSLLLGRVVVDETGLGGAYDVEVKWSPDDFTAESNVPDGEPRGSVFAVLHETLGLRLESARGPVRVLVIDEANKVPMGN